jgi:hypothetical protein
MKKILVTFLFLTATTSIAFGQTEKGRMGFYGGLTAQSYSHSDQTGTDFYLRFYPSFLIFIEDNIALQPGITANYTLFQSGHAFGIGTNIGLNYYFGQSEVKPFITATAGYNSNKTYVNNGTLSSDGINLGGGIGVMYFINNSVGISTSLNYTRFIDYHAGNANVMNNLFTFGVGISYILPK